MNQDAKRIYIADDEDNIRQVVRTFLTSDGYQVEDFPTGDLLLERFRQESCDLVILDVMMPGSDGFTICTELRRISTVTSMEKAENFVSPAPRRDPDRMNCSACSGWMSPTMIKSFPPIDTISGVWL